MNQPGYQVPGRTPVEPFPDSGYWNQQFRSEPYYLEGDSYEDYDAAYRTGFAGRSLYPDLDFDAAEPRLRQEWEAAKGSSRLDWDRARLAVQRAWERALGRGEPHGQ
ncbi:MAG TPA: hypothetical protein VFF91_13710 [Pseudoxanthomonas sp.]|nr:hypothetical protein [Pseudoxanthomonas sp.]